MSTSLAKIKSQIARLQKQAATIETGIVARIRAEIEKHGLTAEQLFGGSSVGAAPSAGKPKATARGRSAKAAKFADGTGNTWGGMGKRPQWIRDALEAGKSLEDFLVAGKKSVVKAKPAAKVASAKKVKAAKKATAPKKQTAATKAASTNAAPAAAKRSVKAAAKKTSAKKPAKTRAAAAPVEPAQAPTA